MDSEALQSALRAIAEDRAAKANRLITGGCTHDEYKYICGEIHGLDLAVDQIKAAQKKDEDRDDE